MTEIASSFPRLNETAPDFKVKTTMATARWPTTKASG